MNVILQKQQGDFQLTCPAALKGVVPALLQDLTSTYTNIRRVGHYMLKGFKYISLCFQVYRFILLE